MSGGGTKAGGTKAGGTKAGGTFHERRVLTSPRKADIIPFGLPDAAAASALSWL